MVLLPRLVRDPEVEITGEEEGGREHPDAALPSRGTVGTNTPGMLVLVVVLVVDQGVAEVGGEVAEVYVNNIR